MEEGRQQSPTSGVPDEQALESLLRHARSRPVPPEGDRRAVERAVRDEWLRVTGRRRWRRRAVGFSAAASLAAVVALLLWTGGAPVDDPTRAEVARVVKVTGRVRALAGGAEDGGDLSGGMAVRAGQAVRTAPGSGIALVLEEGISLRVDQESLVEFISGHSLHLQSGRVYVDTGSDGRSPEGVSPGASPDFSFEILTSTGIVRHFGTQYMVGVDDRRLKVRVRSGAVRFVAPGGAPVFVSDGQQLSFSQHGEPELAPTDTHGDQWQWAEELGPGFVLEGRSLAEFLAWVAHETGLELKYHSNAEKLAAEQTVLHGTIDLPAREALGTVLMGSDLRAEIGDGVIEIGWNPDK